LALGDLVGRIRIGPVQLGSVTGCLLMGVLIGMVGIDLPVISRTFFFLLFLFATGFAVGPQFFAGLRRDGLKLAFFSVLVCVMCVGLSLVVALIMGWDAGTAAGLLAGANTSSIIIGIANDTLTGIDMDPVQRKVLIDNIPMAYAVTYIFGTAGTAWFMVAIGAKLLDKDVAARCKELEVSMGAAGRDDIRTAHERVGYRAYCLTQIPQGRETISVKELEQHLSVQAHPAFVVRVAHGEKHVHATPELMLHANDSIVLMARHDFFPDMERLLGPEASDQDLLSFPVDTARILVTNKNLAGRTLADLREEPQARGLGLRWLKRGGVNMPIVPDLTLQLGDQVELIGAKEKMDEAVSWLGYGEGSGMETNIVLIASAIAIGTVVGLLEYRLGSVPITLSLSGGVLIWALFSGGCVNVIRAWAMCRRHRNG
jgi:putative transport protein